MASPRSIFSNLPAQLPDELVTTLVTSNRVRIERILFRVQASPEGLWYDQDQTEFVTLLKGAARIRFEGDNEPTVWLTVHHA